MHCLKECVDIRERIGVVVNCLVELPVVHYLAGFGLRSIMVLPVDNEDR